MVIRFSNRINSLQFITNKDFHSPQFGGYEGQERTYKLANGYAIDGIYGMSSGYLNQIGFYIVTIDVNV